MKNIKFIIIAIVMGCLIMCGYWIYNNFEFEKVEVEFSTETNNDPLLAAKKLLEQMGTLVTTIQYFPEQELNNQDTLILLQYNNSLDEQTTQKVLNWVDNGGHLIVVSNVIHNEQNIDIQPDLLFKKLNIFQYQNDSIATQIKPTEFMWQQYKLQVLFDSNYYLKANDDEPIKNIQNNYGNHLLQYYYGTGIIIVLSDLSFIENDKIAAYDHAQFLWHLTHFERLETKIWLLNYTLTHNTQNTPVNKINNLDTPTKIPSLLTLIWTYMWTVVISATILLLFWVWSVSQRFGPLLPMPKPVRRSLLEHIEASGNFLWRHSKTTTLLNNVRQTLMQQINATHPNWKQLSASQLSQQLAQKCKLPAIEIEDILTGKNTNLIQTVKIISKIRKAI
ncbi:MAG: DUF4350 domain-containing protein [Candidatus Marithrix sp.]